MRMLSSPMMKAQWVSKRGRQCPWKLVPRYMANEPLMTMGMTRRPVMDGSIDQYFEAKARDTIQAQASTAGQARAMVLKRSRTSPATMA
ncbi:hypothetical protein D3C87_1428340 [compost metagenome]